jgi:hypothetical protein
MNASAFRIHADALLERELRRGRGRWATVAPERRGEVEQVVVRASQAVVEGVLDQARDEPLLAHALLSLPWPAD